MRSASSSARMLEPAYAFAARGLRTFPAFAALALRVAAALRAASLRFASVSFSTVASITTGRARRGGYACGPSVSGTMGTMRPPEDNGESHANEPVATPGAGDGRSYDATKAVEAALHLHLYEHLRRIEGLLVNAGRRVDLRGDLQQVLPAWLRPTQGEPRWPVTLAVLVAIGLQLVVPEDLAARPRWLLPVVEFALLILLVAANPRRIVRDRRWVRVASLALVATASLANIWSAARLVDGLVHGTVGEQAGPLLAYGAAIWSTNVIVFALWYWEFDRGGPIERAKATRTYPDFQFPQMVTPAMTDTRWEPQFFDYLYVSFTNAAAFSPTDTMPLSRWAKLLMLGQSCVSLATVALVIARAVNILK
jgi:uncharacterized membrane protein